MLSVGASDGPVVPAPPQRNASYRIKLYRLNGSSAWDDVGTGFVSLQKSRSTGDLMLIVLSENGSQLLLERMLINIYLYMRLPIFIMILKVVIFKVSFSWVVLWLLHCLVLFNTVFKSYYYFLILNLIYITQLSIK